MFTSGKHSHDPKPYVVIRVAGEQGQRVADPPAGTLAEVFLDPRGTFDHHNPILAQFREEVDGGHWQDEMGEELTAPEVARLWLAGKWSLPEDTIDQLDHARRVLTKLSALAD